MHTGPLREANSGVKRNGGDWWLNAPQHLRGIEQKPTPPQLAAYRLGDTVLEIATDDPSLHDAFRQFYGDCADADAEPSAGRIRCTLRRAEHPRLILLGFDEELPADAAMAAYHLLRGTHAEPPYSVTDSPLPGWRLAGGVREPLLAARGRHVLLAAWMVPPLFLAEYLAGLALSAQPQLMAIHAASLRIGDAGVVVAGGSHAGKTTMALHLAARGHELYGDELALIRLATRELLPFRRTVTLRPGPRAAELSALLKMREQEAKLQVDSEGAGHWRIGRLFGETAPSPVPLRTVFVLAGFENRPSAAPFQFSLADENIIGWFGQPAAAYCSWGLTSGTRTLRLLALRQLLAQVPCWRLKAGSPTETAILIEQITREQERADS